MRMRHGVPEIEMNDDCFHAESTVANFDPQKDSLTRRKTEGYRLTSFECWLVCCAKC